MKERIEIDKPLTEALSPPPQGPSAPEEPGHLLGGEEGPLERDDRARLREIWRIIRKRLPLIVVVAVIATTVVTIEIYRTKSLYQATAVVEVGSENSTLVRTGEVIIQSDEPYDAMMTSKTMLIRSTPLLEDVASKLALDKNPRFFDVAGRKSYWDALGTVFSRLYQMVQRDPSQIPQIPAAIQPAQAGGELTRTPAETARLAPYVGVIQGYLSVDPVQFSRVLNISFTHTEPALAAAVANAAAEAFILRNYKNKTERFTSASAWLDRTTRELKARVEQSQKALTDYCSEHNIFTTDTKETLTSEKLAKIHELVLNAETQSILKKSLYDEVRQGHIADLPESFTDNRTTTLQGKLEDLTTESAQLAAKLGPENPRILDLKDQIGAIKQQIEANRSVLEAKLRAEFERAAREEAALKAAFERSKAEAVEQNQATIKFNLLKQDLDTTKQLYTDFLQKTNQANIEVAQQSNNVRLIQPASVPGSPISPNRPRVIFIGLLVSLFAGLILAFGIEYFDNTLKSVEDVNQTAQLPVLGVVPTIGQNEPGLLSAVMRRVPGADPAGKSGKPAASFQPHQVMIADARSALGETYRVLRTSLLLSSGSAGRRTVLFTSGQPGDGKTTTVINLAVALSQLDATVLIVDADMRKPKGHKAFGVEAAPGLSNYLSEDADLSPLIRELPVPNLSLLPCGPIPPNPAELLSSRKMRDLIAQLGRQFDHVLIDSPPVMGATDPVILSTMVSGVVMVIHAGKTTREIVRRAKHEITAVGGRFLGVVLNNLDVRSAGRNSYYASRYYYSYGEKNRGQ